ncbi:DMT family transporter [Qipengyuania oceanensis]|uniref:EamA family transporter n=1 Tax=Qipengyuania oceanensis TaxID=1463597 RepID=A0A844YIG0_9SPHN|nr:DMT family transporter [Qipengyuania oceanensis]MXO63523.1 EamA family transporter [Qipengyuania oceanensis]
MDVEHGERRGQWLALAGFATLSCGDAIIKTMAGEWPPVAVATLRFSIGAVMLTSLLLWKEGPQAFWPRHPWLQAFRGLCLAGASLLFFSAIYVMPLAEAMALTFLAPIFTALLSGPILKEKVRPVVFVACAMALVGVFIVLRPNLAELGLVALFPLGSALFFSCMVIANRASAGHGSALSMQVFMSVVAAPLLLVAAIMGDATGLAPIAPIVPDWSVAARCAIVAVTASTAHYLIYLGTARAGASSVAPMSYVQIIVASILGWAIFGNIPDVLTWTGVAVIVGSGLFLWWRTRKSAA